VNADCEIASELCLVCANGSCAGIQCVQGECVRQCSQPNPPPPPAQACQADADCVLPAICQICADGSCAEGGCRNGVCGFSCQ
jgi:hypothetical protein